MFASKGLPVLNPISALVVGDPQVGRPKRLVLNRRRVGPAWTVSLGNLSKTAVVVQPFLEAFQRSLRIPPRCEELTFARFQYLALTFLYKRTTPSGWRLALLWEDEHSSCGVLLPV